MMPQTFRFPVTTAFATVLFGSAIGPAVGIGLSAQAIRLTLVDSSSNAPIVNAIVVAATANGPIAARGLTTRSGTLVLRLGSVGSYSLLVRKLGFAPVVSDSISLAGFDTVSVILKMTVVPQFLAPVAIRSERESIRNASFAGMKIGTLGGTVITPSQVDVALPGASDFTDLVSRNPSAGLSVDYERKCVMSNRGDPPMCLPVIVDGLLLSSASDVVPPEIVDYMIILRGNEIGVLYGSIGEHGAVLVFTKRGLRRGPERF